MEGDDGECFGVKLYLDDLSERHVIHEISKDRFISIILLMKDSIVCDICIRIGNRYSDAVFWYFIDVIGEIRGKTG